MLEEARVYLARAKKVNLIMVAVNILVFAALSLLGRTEDSQFMLRMGAGYAPLIRQGEYYRLLTSMFMHFGLQHLIYNMICLLSLGDLLEGIVGPAVYLVIYLFGGLGGNLASMAWETRTGRYAVSAGASGAIFAVIGALLAILLLARNHRNQNFIRRLSLMAVLMIAQGFLDTGTDNAAHIGGFAAGALFALVLWPLIRRRRRA